MRTPRLIPFLLPIVLAAFQTPALLAQETIVVDLAQPNASDTLPPGRYAIRVINRLPEGTYRVSVSLGTRPIAPIGLPAAMGGVCNDLVDATEALDDATSEDQVPALLRQLEAALRGSSTNAACTGPERDRAEWVRESTQWTHPTTYSLGEEQFLRITVQRVNKNGQAERTWQKYVAAEGGGGWRVSYGYSMPLLTVGPTYRSYNTEAVGTRFVITGERAREELDAIPSLFFNYAPADERGLKWNMLTAGLGVDLREPVLMLGTGLTYYGNLSVSLGGSVRRENVLRSGYSVGDTLEADVKDDQLRERVFRFRPYVSLSIRFDRNPFAKKQEEEQKTEGQPAGESGNPANTAPAGTGTTDTADTDGTEDKPSPADTGGTAPVTDQADTDGTEDTPSVPEAADTDGTEDTPPATPAAPARPPATRDGGDVSAPAPETGR